MANIVAKALGVKLELVPVTAANRIPNLLTDKVDINIALMSVTPERAKQMMFTAPYVNTALAVFGPKDVKASRPHLNQDQRRARNDGGARADGPESQADLMRTDDNATAVQAYLSGQSKRRHLVGVEARL
jgi:polar amino acid transport system substrate-binding protein